MFFYRKLRKRLRNAYGKRPQGEYYDGDMNWISTFYEDCRKDGRDPFYVDDITWNDLNMDAVYKRINCCCSTAGERQLYYMLRRPMNREQYEKQSSLIRMMEQEPEKRLNLQVILSRIGIYRSVFLGHILRPQNPSKKWLIIYLLMLLRHILGEDRIVAMENPSYLRAAQIFKSFGYEICPVRMDADGMLPGSVADSGADLVYAMPAHQFPVGCIMPVGRRAALLGWATDAADRYIIEDDYDSEFRYRGKPIPALQSLDRAGRVIYIGTFSKAIAPAIRISYMILPPELLTRYREKCWFFSSTVSRIDQRILNEFMKNGHFERHLNRMRSLYRARHDELLSRLRHCHKRG